MRYQGMTALVTGASSGIGEQFAATLAARGSDLVLVARRAHRLDAIAARLRADHGVTVTVLPADLSRPGAGLALRSALDERGVRIGILVNSAGLGATGPFETLSAESVHDQIAVNAAALTGITHALLPGLRREPRAAIVNIASFTGHHPVPGMAVYAATKAYVLSFTEALAHELRDTGVRVVALSPGSTSTEFYASSGTSEHGVRFQTPADVVSTAMRALDASRTPVRVISGTANRLALGVLRWLPRRTVLALMSGSVHAT